MNSIQENFIKEISENDKIAFGPFIGELGWELYRWCGFVRWVKNTYYDKKIYAITRSERIDLYSNNVDDIIPFDIDGDYHKYRPNMYRLDYFSPSDFKNLFKIITDVIDNDIHIIKTINTPNRNIFDFDKMDFNFKPRANNKGIIYNILNKKKYINKIPIVISPRHRIDLEKGKERNWREDYWNDLFELIEKSEKFICFIPGLSGSILKPDESLESFIILEDYLFPQHETSLIGLTIEAIKASKLTIGQQSAIPILSNYLKIPTLMWGHEKHRHLVLENPFKTQCDFYEEKTLSYKTDYRVIFNKILALTKSKPEKKKSVIFNFKNMEN